MKINPDNGQWIAIFSGVILFALTGFLIADRLTVAEYTAALGASAVFISGVWVYMNKDSKKSQ